MNKLANAAAYFFIGTSLILTLISMAGVWNVFNEDVIVKSFESIGLIAFASIVVMVADGFSTRKQLSPQEVVAYNATVESFKDLRAVSNTILITAVAICVFLGLLSIWDIMTGDVLYKSLASLAILGFYGLITTIVCTKRIDDLKASTKLATQTMSPEPAPQMPTPQAIPPQPTQEAASQPIAPQI